MSKYVYAFYEGNQDMRNLLGGKGVNLAEMVHLGLPVPLGFIVTTETCNKYYDDNENLSEIVQSQILEKLTELEQLTNKKYGDLNDPLLLSVRSGARVSMPGMMDTILNLGLNDEIIKTFGKNNPRFVYDSYRRLIQMYADVVKEYPKEKFQQALDNYKKNKKVDSDNELSEIDMLEIVNIFKELYLELGGESFPQDPKQQLIESIKAVFRSWNNERAKIYRKMNDISDDWGTAVNVQQMVYGNINENSGTGVAFSRNPSTGENELYGEYLINAQGEDVVAGIRTPQPISTLENIMPDIYHQFYDIAKKLEKHYKDMQDMEFTIENGKLYILQTRNGKRTAISALQIAVDLETEGLITKEEAIMRVEPNQLNQLLHPTFDKQELEKSKVIAKGLPASPGAGTGKIYFNAEDIELAKKRGEETLLVRLETSPEDIQGIHDANGILTIRGGMTSHAAVVARGMGRCCVSGCEELTIDEVKKTLLTKDGKRINEGDFLSIDGSTGYVYGEKIPTTEPQMSDKFKLFMSWADEFRKLGVRANADTALDAKKALEYGAEGIGLCRTEHMFFEEKRLFSFRKMILADSSEERNNALDEILPYQCEEFEKMFEVMNGLPVVIRYLDPPLHEFLPHTELEIKALAKKLKIDIKQLNNKISKLKEVNPMMGNRGCRISITYPEIAKMQTKAIIQAAISMRKKGIEVVPEIMIPLIGEVKELIYLKNIIIEVAEQLLKENQIELVYHIGTMIEIPRACVTADEIAKEVSFFSFGTNDLTQMTYGFSRDDASKFLNNYYEKRIFNQDPFAKIDQKGVGRLMRIAIKLAKSTNPSIHLGICGEHGGEVSSIDFCHKIGLDYVSCSTFRIPVARLAEAQINIKRQ